MDEKEKTNLPEPALSEQLAQTIALQQAQLTVAKKQLTHSRIITVLLLCSTLFICGCILSLMPKFNSILTNLHEISQEINDQDPIDVESLNRSLQNLQTVLGEMETVFSPLANLIGKLPGGK